MSDKAKLMVVTVGLLLLAGYFLSVGFTPAGVEWWGTGGEAARVDGGVMDGWSGEYVPEAKWRESRRYSGVVFLVFAAVPGYFVFRFYRADSVNKSGNAGKNR
jgi:hypothetical protein